MTHENGPMMPGPLGRTLANLGVRSQRPHVEQPATVAGGLGVVPGAPIDTTKTVPEPRKMSAAQAERLMMAELLAAMRSLTESSTELAARLGRRGAVNSVLDVYAATFGASGVLTRSYEVTVGSIVIVNLSAANTITYSVGAAAGDTGGPNNGVGVQFVGPGVRLAIPVADRAITLTGTAGDRFGLQAFTGLQAFGIGGA